MRTHAPPPIASPFASATAVEGDVVQVFPLGEPVEPPDGAAFLDGIQRYGVAGRFGLVPVVRGYVAAAVLRRDAGSLAPVLTRREEFLAVPLARLSGPQRDALEQVDLTLVDVANDERPHPLLDLQAAAVAVERRRSDLEDALAADYLRDADGWLVVDGSLAGVVEPDGSKGRVVGVVKSHETQYLHGRDLEVALTLPAAYRTSVFRRSAGGRRDVYTWYLRQWPWEDHDLLHGLVRIERPAVSEALDAATWVSRWIFGERAPLAAPDRRWDRLLYPIHQVEVFLRAQAGRMW
jgi:hypothetical protein